MYKKEDWKKVGGYCGDLPTNDWSMWLKLGRLGKFYNFQEIFVCYSTDSQNISKQNVRYDLREDIKMRKKHCNDYPNFWKAYLLSHLSYVYSFFPCKKQLFFITQFIKKHIIKKYVKFQKIRYDCGG